MKSLDPVSAARAAVSATRERPATAVIHDSEDLRLVVFRIAPGQAVAPHRSTSSVMLTVLEGSGSLAGEAGGQLEERDFNEGDVVTYEPNEMHGMRARDTELLLLATITPRPGGR